MDQLLRIYAQYVAWGVEAIATTLIAIGAIEAVISGARLLAHGRPGGAQRRAVWLAFARWLVAGLTFQLAADIVNTSTAPTWQELGRLASVAVIRTFLSYFLDREVDSERARQHEAPGSAAAAPHHGE